MLEIYERLGTHTDKLSIQSSRKVDARLILNHEQRDKGRLKTMTEEGEEARLFLKRGKPLQLGEYLRSQCGKTIIVEGAIEPVTVARSHDWLTFSKACYHLGNRHVKMQVGERWLRITPDHVLEEMLQKLGLYIVRDKTVFVPESGAYHNLSHRHTGSHDGHVSRDDNISCDDNVPHFH